MLEHVKTAYLNAAKALNDFITDENMELTTKIATGMAKSFTSGNKIMICGNGGSACDAMHFAEEFTGRYRKDRNPLPVMHLADAAHVTCVANDFGFEEIFSRNVAAFGKSGDWFIGLSTSGNSANVIKALKQAQSMQVHTLALLGKDGGKMKGMADYEITVPVDTSDRIQEIHMMILHIIIEGIERTLFPENYT